MLETAIDAAHAAGEILSRYFESVGLEREVKDDKSFVTKADREAETAVVSIIADRHPDHGIVGEEGSALNPDSPYQWIIDPLDGTTNFVNGIPIFGVSIALAHNRVPIIGVVYNPVTHSLSAAEKGKGTTYNGTPVRVSSQLPTEGIITFGPGPKDHDRARARALFAAAHTYLRSARMLGSTACELSFLSRGGTEAFICLGLKEWDYAAGALLIQEAGGRITTIEGDEWTLGDSYFIASNGISHDAVRALARSVP